MKHITVMMLAALILGACDKLTLAEMQKSVPFVFSREDGTELSLGEVWYYEIAGSGTVFIPARGKMVYEMPLVRIRYDAGRLKTGTLLPVTQCQFSLPASSDSRDYTEEYTGAIYLLRKSEYELTLRMQHVRWETANYGAYRMDGDIVLPYNFNVN